MEKSQQKSTPNRESIERDLKEIGLRRKEALERAEAELDRLRHLYPAARAAGIPIARISAQAFVSRPTLYALEHGGEDTEA